MLDAGLLCTFQRIDPLTGAHDEDDLAIRDLPAMLCIDQRLEVGTTAADQHGNSSFCVHLFSSYAERDILKVTMSGRPGHHRDSAGSDTYH